MTPEGKVKEHVKKILAHHGAYWHCPVMNGMGAPSLDFACCHRGWYFAIETKAAENIKPTLRQNITIEKIRAAGGKVFVIGGTVGFMELANWLEWVNARSPEK